MSHSELHPFAKGRLGSTQPQMTSALPNLASISDCGFVEMVWENGQILMRGGASSRTQKSPPSCISFSSHTSSALEKVGGDSFNTKSARYETLDSILGDSPSLGPPGRKELSKHDKIGPYLNKYPHTNSLQDAYHPELLPESYEPDLNAFTEHNDATTIDKSNCHDKQLMDSHTVSLQDNSNLKQGNTFKFLGAEPQLTKPRKSWLYQSSLQQCQASKMEEQDPGPNKKMGLVNFSHFLRPAALVKARIQSFGATMPTTSPGELKNTDKRSAADTSNPVESMPIQSASGSKFVTGFQNQLVPMATKAELVSSIAKPQKEPFPDEHSEAICQEDASRKNGSLDQVLGRASSFSAKGKPDTKKSIEPLAASSSVCSHGASNDPTYYLKRKYQDTEESSYLSENDEEEPEAVTKAAPARASTGAKRGRTAEVHNLSERTRRDKINKKIRTLQELIPNCNKVDKASMLDEAIEYLRTLQLQVQIMSMGTGLCMPPMMLPTGMQHMINVPHLTHFFPMGVGMGMRMGMGISCSPAQFHCSPISGATALPGITGTGLQMLGLPSQVLPMSASCAPFINPLPGGPSAQSLLVHDVVSGAASIVEHPTSAPTSCSKDSIHKINLDILRNANVECSRPWNQKWCQATNDGSKHSALV